MSGEYEAPIIKDTAFGDFYDIPLDHGIIVLHRQVHGWKVPDDLNGCYLSHQLYVANIAKYTVPAWSYEIIALHVASGSKVTLWASSKKEVTYPPEKHGDIIKEVRTVMKLLETIPPIYYDKDMVRSSVNSCLCSLDSVLENMGGQS